MLRNLLGDLDPDQFIASLSGLVKPYNEEQFQQGVVEPTMKNYNESVLPGIQERFLGANAGSSSALNQAVAKSAEDLSNSLAGQRINYQQMLGGQNTNGLQLLMSLLGQRSIDPIVQGPQTGVVQDLIRAGGQVGSAFMFSSKQIKENIKPYSKGLDVVRDMDVKQYDYTIPVEGNQTGRIGLIAEELPSELTGEKEGYQAVDLYGLVSVLVNCVKQLDARIKELEA